MKILTWPIKIIEFTLSTACFILLLNSYDLTNKLSYYVGFGVYFGMSVVILGELIGEVLLVELDRSIDAWWSCTGAGLFACSGYLIIQNWYDVERGDRMTSAKTNGILAVLNAVVLAIDGMLAVSAGRHNLKGSGSTMSSSPTTEDGQC